MKFWRAIPALPAGAFQATFATDPCSPPAVGRAAHR